MKKTHKFRYNRIHILFFGIFVFTLLLIFLFVVLAIVRKDIVYKIKNMEYFSITLQGNYLLVEDNEEYIPIQI